MPLIFYMVFAILLLFSILFISSALTAKTTTIEAFSSTVNKQFVNLTYVNKLQDKMFDLENKILGSIKHVKKGVEDITKTLLDVNRMQTDETYDEDVNILFDDTRLEKYADKFRQNIINEYNTTKPSEKNISILNFVIFDKSETTPKPHVTNSYTGGENVFPYIKSYSNYLKVINNEMKDLFEVSNPSSLDQQAMFKKQIARLEANNAIDVIKKLKAFRKRYMIKSKSGNIEFDSKFHKDWIDYYPDNDFYTNDELDAFLKRRVQALVEILDIDSEDEELN